MTPAEAKLAAAYAAFVTAERMVAYHEAGHAAIGMALKYPPLSAEVQLKPGRPVVALVTSPVNRPLSVLDGCCMLLAGHFAEIRHLEETAPGFDYEDVAERSASDFLKVDETLALGGFVADALTFQILFDTTRQLVNENWDAIERIAEELLREGKLDTAQIEAAFAAVEVANAAA